MLFFLNFTLSKSKFFCVFLTLNIGWISHNVNVDRDAVPRRNWHGLKHHPLAAAQFGAATRGASEMRRRAVTRVRRLRRVSTGGMSFLQRRATRKPTSLSRRRHAAPSDFEPNSNSESHIWKGHGFHGYGSRKRTTIILTFKNRLNRRCHVQPTAFSKSRRIHSRAVYE